MAHHSLVGYDLPSGVRHCTTKGQLLYVNKINKPLWETSVAQSRKTKKSMPSASDKTLFTFMILLNIMYLFMNDQKGAHIQLYTY